MLAALALVATIGQPGTTVSYRAKLDAGASAFAVSNRAPLAPGTFHKLPIGAIQPEGWVRTQLELEANGFSGRLTEISPWLKKANNAWLSKDGKGEHGWEEVPYWLKGFGDLGYVLGDKRIIAEAKIWINGVLSSQRPNGYFGPESNLTANNGKPDVWPNMPMLSALRSYYEYSGDKRVLALMSRYFRWEMTIPDADFLLSYWEPQRVGDNIDSIYWLFNRTGERSLFDLVDKLHHRGANWIAGVPNWHGVNFAQGFREPAEIAELTHDSSLVGDTERDYETIRRLYGEVPGGMYAADENARKGFGDPRQAAETCAMVEMMLSDEMLLRITGDPIWAERCEDVTFNSLPASMTADLKSLHYLTSPNLIRIDARSKSPDVENGGPMFLYNAYDHRCCQHNTAMGWPYYAENLWYGTAHNGLGVALYAPSTVHTRVGSGSAVTIQERTTYPFDEVIKFSVQATKPCRFPLSLRWPSWCDKPVLSVNGIHLATTGNPGGYLVVERTWGTGDQVTLRLPMHVATRTWAGNKGAVSVERGPLTYSLRIGEKKVRAGGTNAFPSYEVDPTTPWNYGLITKDPAFRVVERPLQPGTQPFDLESAPIEIFAKARKIPEWQEDHLGMVGLLQAMPARTTSPVETVTLIPMGAARLRISSFPTVTNRPSAQAWKPQPPHAKVIPAKASHVFSGDTVDALSQHVPPVRSDNQSIPRFTWWDHKGGREWVEYDFPTKRSLSSASVYWFDDRTINGGCRVPLSWRLLHRVGNDWVPVATSDDYGVQLNAYNRVRFEKVSTSSVRLEVQLQPNFSGGILGWDVN